MPREPMKRQGNQSIDSMAEQLAASKAGNKLYKPQYNELSAELKAQALDVAIVQQQELLARADQRGAVDLNDLNAVKIACNEYLESCRRSKVYPSMTALAPALGYSRQYIYAYMGRHNTPVTQYLDALRSSMAAIVQQAGLTRTADAAMSIFILKNSAGMSDKLEMSVTPPEDNGQDREMTAEEIARRYGVEIDSDED